VPDNPLPWTVSAFQKNRRATWQAVRWWVALLALGITGFSVPFLLESEHVRKDDNGYSLAAEDMTAGEFTLSLLSLVVMFSSGIGIVVAARRHYKCPKCSQVPMSYSGFENAVDLKPSVCSNCGARLS
jgi:DNA polymerase III alpha subunit (gram-positive type)